MTSIAKALIIIRVAAHLQKLQKTLIGEELWSIGDIQKFLPFSRATTQKTLKMMRERDIITFEEHPYKNTIIYKYRVSDYTRAKWLGEDIF
jgi:hypothetical protein